MKSRWNFVKSRFSNHILISLFLQVYQQLVDFCRIEGKATLCLILICKIKKKLKIVLEKPFTCLTSVLMSRSYIPRRESNFSWYFCCGISNLVLHTKAKRGSAVEYTQVCSRAFMSSISLRAISLGGGGGRLGGRGGNGMRLQSLCSAILMMHPCSTIPSRWLCINDLIN